LNHSLPYRQDGYSIRSKYILKFQSEAEIEPLVLTTPGFPAQVGMRENTEEIWDGITYIRPSIPKPDKKLLSYIARQSVQNRLQDPQIRDFIQIHYLRIQLSEAVKKYKPDVLHVASPAKNALATIQVGNEFNIPVVYEVRGLWHDTSVTLGHIDASSMEYKRKQEAFIKAMHGAQGIVTLSQTMKRECVRLGISSEKVSIISNGVDVKEFSPGKRPSKLSYRLGVTEKHIVIGYIGSVRRLEGLDILLRAVNILRGKFSYLKVVIVGKGDDIAHLEHLVEELKLKEIVHLVGEVIHEEISNYYNLIDIL